MGGFSNLNTYTHEQIMDYVRGHMNADESRIDITSLENSLKNAVSMLEDEQCGIDAELERRERNNT